MDKNSLYFPLFVLVHPSPAVVWALAVFFCCCLLSWKMLPKSRQPRDKSRAFLGYFGLFWNAALKFKEKIYGRSQINDFRERCFLTSGGRGMEESLQRVKKGFQLAGVACLRSSTLDGPQGWGFCFSGWCKKIKFRNVIIVILIPSPGDTGCWLFPNWDL